MIKEYSCPQFIEIRGTGINARCDNGVKTPYTPWTVYTITDGGNMISVHVHEKDPKQSFCKK
jgi:hypothetical protein